MRYPIMPLWVGDLIIDTQELTATEFGAYHKLIYVQWKKGSIPLSIDRLEIIVPGIKIYWDQLEDSFIACPWNPSRLINKRCHKTKIEVAIKSEKNRRAVWKRDHGSYIGFIIDVPSYISDEVSNALSGD